MTAAMISIPAIARSSAGVQILHGVELVGAAPVATRVRATPTVPRVFPVCQAAVITAAAPKPVARVAAVMLAQAAQQTVIPPTTTGVKEEPVPSGEAAHPRHRASRVTGITTTRTTAKNPESSAALISTAQSTVTPAAAHQHKSIVTGMAMVQTTAQAGVKSAARPMAITAVKRAVPKPPAKAVSLALSRPSPTLPAVMGAPQTVAVMEVLRLVAAAIHAPATTIPTIPEWGVMDHTPVTLLAPPIMIQQHVSVAVAYLYQTLVRSF